MVNVIGVSATNASGSAVDCSVAVLADEQPIAADIAQLYSLPDVTTAITVVVTPATPSYWPTIISATIDGDGMIVPDATSQVLVTVTTVAVAGARLSTLAVEVSRFMDVTDVVLACLDDIPSQRTENLPPDPIRTVPYDDRPHWDAVYGGWPPPAWDTVPQTGVNYIDQTNPIAADILNFAVDNDVVVDNDNIVLRMAGVDAPQLFTVSWPRAIGPTETSPPTPMLLFFRPGIWQELKYGFYQAPYLPRYPFNYDYAEWGGFQYISYGGDPLSRDPEPKGLPYQVAKSGKNVVTVIPCNRAGFEFGKLMDASAAQMMLEEIQAYMFRRAGVSTVPASIGKVAMGAFSSGNNYLGQFLAAPANRASTFLQDHVTEVFFFDPPGNTADTCVAAALSWQGSDPDRHIRFYAQNPHPGHGKLLGVVPPGDLYVADSPDGRNTAALMMLSSWTRTLVAMLHRPLHHPVTWDNVHQLIPSTMLTHAMAQTDF